LPAGATVGLKHRNVRPSSLRFAPTRRRPCRRPVAAIRLAGSATAHRPRAPSDRLPCQPYPRLTRTTARATRFAPTRTHGSTASTRLPRGSFRCRGRIRTANR